MNIQKSQQGFTLIELMIVVAIIGILASVALPAYQDYVAKSQFTAGLAEITPGKIMTETFINEGTDVPDAAFVGLAASSQNCSLTTAVASSAAGTSTIECTLKGGVATLGKKITWSRSATGVWSCASDADAKYKGKCV